MADTAVPHISLALEHGHEAREPGPMVKKCQESTDWQSSQILNVLFSSSLNAFCIQVLMTDEATLEYVTLRRLQGRELIDHEDSEALLNELPETLWSQGPADVGHCIECAPVKFEIIPDVTVNVWLYPFRQEAADGIAGTLEGLWKAGVLELSASSWNTPILPVKKADGVKYRMAHDLGKVNKVTLTLCVPVPDPHRCLSVLSPKLGWFTSIDLTRLSIFCVYA